MLRVLALYGKYTRALALASPLWTSWRVLYYRDCVLYYRERPVGPCVFMKKLQEAQEQEGGQVGLEEEEVVAAAAAAAVVVEVDT